MGSWFRRRVILIPVRPSPRLALLAATCVFVQVTSGCLSNEYRIPQDELRRLAAAPPEARGQRVRVVQQLGERRGDAVPPAPELSGDRTSLEVQIDAGHAGGGAGRAPAPRGAGWSAGRTPAPTGTAWSASPRVPAPGATGGFRGSPVGGGGGGGHLSLPSGGGGNGGDALIIVAVVLVAVAVVATIGLAAGEGARFDGYVAVAPDQPLHLTYANGGQTVVPFAYLSGDDAAQAVEAVVMDDEGPGVRRLDRAPLDRKGWTFKFDLGTSAFTFGDTRVVGLASHIQTGLFLHPTFGLLADIGLAGGQGCCDGVTVARHSLSLEAQLLPLALGPLHAGLFASGGAAIAGGGSVRASGPLASGGALLEVDVSSRMALTFRAGASAAQLDNGWSTAGSLTGGLAIY